VELVGSGLGDYVDLPAAALTELGGIITDFNLELFDGIDRRAESDVVVILVGVGDSVQLKRILLRPCAADTHSSAGRRSGSAAIHTRDK